MINICFINSPCRGVCQSANSSLVQESSPRMHLFSFLLWLQSKGTKYSQETIYVMKREKLSMNIVRFVVEEIIHHLKFGGVVAKPLWAEFSFMIHIELVQVPKQ